jgi:GNAT superfamily N-acetyltransferase
MLDPDYRGVGLGLLLVNHFIDGARANGLRHLSCMLISDLEADAVKTLEELGFRSTVYADFGADPDGAAHDMTMMVLSL